MVKYRLCCRDFRVLRENPFSPSVTKVAEVRPSPPPSSPPTKCGPWLAAQRKGTVGKGTVGKGTTGAAVATPPAKPAPVPSPLSAGGSSPRKPFLGTTTVPTTEEELLALMKKQTGMSNEYESFTGMLRAQKWVAVLGILRSLESGPLANVEIVSSVIQNVLGPICEAQGIAKAIVGIAGD